MRRRALISVPLVAAVVVLLAPTFLAAGEPPTEPQQPFDPPRLAATELPLADALRLTLQHDPNLLLAAEDVALRAGVTRQASGEFDLTLLGSFTYEVIQSQLTAAEKQQQLDKREDLRGDIRDLEQEAAQADQLIQQLLAARGALEAGTIPEGITFPDPMTQAQWEALLALYRNAPPDRQEQIRQDIIRWLESRIGELQAERDANLLAAEQARAALRALGPIAEMSQQQQGAIDLQLQKRFRTGITLTPFLSLSGSSYRYVGKPRDDTHGGPGGSDTYTSSIGFSVVIPLGRGRGTESAAAAETASRIDWEASRKTLAHTASQRVLETLLAYWDLAAAQASLEVQRRSLQLQDRLDELVRALIEADELPRVEQVRMDARKAQVAAAVDAARRTLHRARVSLAVAAGLEVTRDGEAPLAADPLPDAPAGEIGRLDPTRLGEAALGRRLDLAAARSLERSGKVLWRGAVIDLAPVADLDLKVSYSGLQDTGGSTWEGIRDALTGNWTGPSVRVGFTLEKPLRNDLQEGRLEERAAAYRQLRIASRDLERRIRTDVVETVGTLREAVAELERARAAVEAYTRAFENEVEKLRYGRSTLIDVILTEQRKVEAELVVIEARRTVAQLIAKLRYDTGTLVEADGEGWFRIAGDLAALPATS